MKSKTIYFILALLCAFSFGSCSVFDFFKPKTDLVFSIDQGTSCSGKGILGKGEIALPEDVIWIELKENAKLRNKSLAAGNTTITLPKDSIHLVALTKTGSLDRGGSKGRRDIGNGIQTIGNIQIVGAGLNSIPLSEAAQDQMDLGALEIGENTVVSNIDAELASFESGYDTDMLARISEFDATGRKFLNPDIDQDGRYDEDQGLRWEFRGDYNFTINPVDFNLDLAEPTMEPADIKLDFNYQINFKEGGVTNPSTDGVTLKRFEADSGVLLEVMTGYAWKPSYSNVEFYFLNSDQGKLLPGDGNYILTCPSETTSTYYFSSIKQLKPSDGFEGLLCFQYKFISENGSVVGVEYKWKKIKAGVYVDALPDEVSLRVKQFIVTLFFKDGTTIGMFTEGAGSDADRWHLESKVSEGNQLKFSKPVQSIPFYEGGYLDFGATNKTIADSYSHEFVYTDIFDNYFCFRYIE